jgi:hypothetical protein
MRGVAALLSRYFRARWRRQVGAAALVCRPMAHRFSFFTAGGSAQAKISDTSDLLGILELDQKLWTALAMPVTGVDLDAATLKLLDADGDARIRVFDIKAAITWLQGALKSPGDVLRSKPEVALAAIADAKLVASAKQMLADLGKADASTISVDDAAAVTKAFADTKLNGDGVVHVGSTDDADLATLIGEIIAAHGAVADRSGKDGASADTAKAFFADVEALAAWTKTADGDAATIRALGDGTAAAAAAFEAVSAKLEDYFARCRLAAYDPRAAAAMAGQDADFLALGSKALTSGADDVARLPLAAINAAGRLTVTGGINPAWADKLATFMDVAVTPVLGKRDALTADDVAKVSEKLAAFRAWQAGKPATKLGALDDARIATLATSPLRGKLDELIAADRALEGAYAEISAVEKLVRLQRDFGRILRNFVNFADFYAHHDGVFQAGTLYIDGRAAELCISVSDAGKHGALAANSGAYLAYCDLRRGAATQQVVAIISNGDADNLFVGRNGVFYDRKGDDWDATISKIVSNPISVREAFWSPYKKFAKAIEDQVTKRASAADAAATAKVEAAGTAVGNTAAKDAAAPAAAAPKKGFDLSSIALIGVAIGGIGTLVGALLGSFFGLGKWMPVGVIALLLMISGPSMLLAWLKLRKRNLGPILDANGWAINGRSTVSVRLGAKLTKIAQLPPGTIAAGDPDEDKGRPWKLYIFLITLLVLAGAWYFGKLDGYLPNGARSVTVLGSKAPAYKAPTVVVVPAAAAAPAPTPAPAPAPEAGSAK